MFSVILLTISIIRVSIEPKFTGKERDQESGLDFFGARYMSAAQGRFTSPDPHNILTEASSDEEFTAFIANPQNWNRYAYVLNNPVVDDRSGRSLSYLPDMAAAACAACCALCQ